MVFEDASSCHTSMNVPKPAYLDITLLEGHIAHGRMRVLFG